MYFVSGLFLYSCPHSIRTHMYFPVPQFEYKCLLAPNTSELRPHHPRCSPHHPTTSNGLRQTPTGLASRPSLVTPFVRYCLPGKLGQVYMWWHNTYVEATVPSVPHLPLLLLLFLPPDFDQTLTPNCSRSPLMLTSE